MMYAHANGHPRDTGEWREGESLDWAWWVTADGRIEGEEEEWKLWEKEGRASGHLS